MSALFETMLFTGLCMILCSSAAVAAGHIGGFSPVPIVSGMWFGWSAVQLWKMWNR